MMAMLINDPHVEESLKAQRQASGADRFDEVWESLYMMPPMPGTEHQQLVMQIAAALQAALMRTPGAQVFPGINISDRIEGWEQNYRIPDVAVFLPSSTAVDCGSHWCGGPDFAVEVISPGDRTREKLPFYAQIGTRELLIIDREPWSLELWECRGGELVEVARATLTAPGPIASRVVPLEFGLQADEPRPRVEVRPK